MILVTGAVMARPDTFEAVRRLGLEHSRRSRSEPGCLSHDLHVDCEDPLRLVFVERWADRGALATHFALPASRAFVREVRGLAAEPTRMSVYEAEKIRIEA